MTRDHQFYGHNHRYQQEQHHMINQIQGIDETDQNQTDHHHYNHQIFRSNANMGLMIDFSKQHQIRMTSGPDHHHHHQSSVGADQNQLLEDSSSSSMRRLCNVNNDFPKEVNDERPSQGLSLSLSSSNPTSIQGYSSQQNLQHSQMMMLMMMNSPHQNNNHQQQFQIGSCKYLSPAQELLGEFCSLGVKESDEEVMMMKNKRKQKGKQQQDEWVTTQNNNNDQHDQYSSTTTTSSKNHVPPLHSLEFMELQKRKTKLLSLLQELKRRYGHYREQMRVATEAFEAAMGVGATEMYTTLASRAMSRHFRCLKDGLVSQIQAMSQALGEDNNRVVSKAAARGDETPRLRLLDQALRQQKSYRQMSLVEAHPWRPQRGLPERAVMALRAWLFEHFLHPYPSDIDKHILARQSGLSRGQVSNWFINARVRLWKPMIEEMYSEETRGEQMEITNPMMIDTKPEPNQIIRVEPESLTSIVTNPTSKTGHNSLGSTFDFSLYGNQAVTYAGEGGGPCGGDVSLTLGLQRNDGNGGVSLSLSPVTAQGEQLYYSRDHIEVGSVQYPASMLDGDQVHNLPYTNLTGAQLLHDMV